jgi:AAA ATPase domain
VTGVSEREVKRSSTGRTGLPVHRPGARVGPPRRPSAPGPFVGRRRELELLQRCLTEALAGRPQLVLVEGEAGVGKSRLLQEMRERARECDAQALRGRCSEDLPFPYRPFVEALEEPLEDVLGAEAGALAHLLQRGSIDHLGDRDRRTGSGAEQLGLFRAISRGCLSLAQLRPTMLLLEDLHWADGSSLDLLEHVVFAVSEAAMRAPVRLIILCTYRGGEIGARLARTLARLRREDIAVTVELPGLDEGEIQLLIRALGLGEPTHQLVTSVSATTRGNPLFLRELLHDLAKRGALRRRACGARVGGPSSTAGCGSSRTTDGTRWFPCRAAWRRPTTSLPSRPIPASRSDLAVHHPRRRRPAASARSTSRFSMRSRIASRLSCSFLPRPSPSSALARPFTQ